MPPRTDRAYKRTHAQQKEDPPRKKKSSGDADPPTQSYYRLEEIPGRHEPTAEQVETGRKWREIMQNTRDYHNAPDQTMDTSRFHVINTVQEWR